MAGNYYKRRKNSQQACVRYEIVLWLTRMLMMRRQVVPVGANGETKDRNMVLHDAGSQGQLIAIRPYRIATMEISYKAYGAYVLERCRILKHQPVSSLTNRLSATL